MKRIIKKTFLPHKKDNPRPLFWHPLCVSLLSLSILFICGFLTLGQNKNINGTRLLGDVRSGAIISFTNKERVGGGLSTLTENNILTQAANLKAKDMADKGYFAHYSPEGLSPWFWFDKAGYEYQKAGENLAVNFDDSKEIVSAWMNSPTHKENIMKDGYSEIGIGTAKGIYKGREAIFVVQLFASPKQSDTSLAFSIEKKVDNSSLKRAEIQGIEITKISKDTVFHFIKSSEGLSFIILSILSFVIIFAIVTVFIRRKHTQRLFIPIIILVILLGVSLYTQYIFIKDLSIIYQ